MDLNKKNVLILGAGKTGIACAKFLIEKAKNVLLSESNKEPINQKKELEYLTKNGAKIEFNKNSDEFIKQSDLIVISPGISPFSELIKKIEALKIPIISEIELARHFTSKPVISVTGTNGKTTTTSLITHLVNNSGKKAIACGNIGTPFIEAIKNDANIDYYVIEVSSFQIYYSSNFSSEIAVCLNITPDHFDWHKSFEHYIESKEKLFRMQKKDSWAITNLNDKIISSFRLLNNVFPFSLTPPKREILNSITHLTYLENDLIKVKTNEIIEEIIKKEQLKIIGSHNIENTLASIAACKIINLQKDKIAKSLSSFNAVEHRLEFVKATKGKEFFNDSKATNPEATIKAVEAIKDSKKGEISLILGGRDKNTDLTEMIQTIKKNVSEVILYGEAKERFKGELSRGSFKQIYLVNDLSEAINVSLNSNTKVVLFSPACSSFDMFKNYEDRGKHFKELVSKL